MKSNRQKGTMFAESVRNHLNNRGIKLYPECEVNIGINGEQKKTHKFDWGNESLVVECKSYNWTVSGKFPSAKFSTANEALLFLVAAPQSLQKMLFMMKTKRISSRRQETLSEYYIQAYNHLFPKDQEVMELNSKGTYARRLWLPKAASAVDHKIVV